MYENTGTRAHVMAAELIDAGVAVHEIYHRLYEGIPYGKLELLARGLAHVERYDGGALTLTHLSAADYLETGAEENYSEGVVDHLRSVEGTAVAGLVRDLLGEGQEGRRKVSLRATDGRVDVSRIARVQGGGGHRQAAGFSTELPWEELVRFLRDEVAAQLECPTGSCSSTSRPGRRRMTSSRRCDGSVGGRWGMREPWTPSPPGC
jgi:phosphoesterase RecJ-like protein